MLKIELSIDLGKEKKQIGEGKMERIVEGF